MCSRACREDVTITDVTIKTPDRKYDRGREGRHAPEAMCWGFWNLKKTVSWDSTLEEDTWFSGARRGQTNSLRRGAARSGVRWKSQHRKKLSLSPHVEKPQTQKSNKKFRTWTKRVIVFVSQSSFHVQRVSESSTWPGMLLYSSLNIPFIQLTDQGFFQINLIYFCWCVSAGFSISFSVFKSHFIQLISYSPATNFHSSFFTSICLCSFWCWFSRCWPIRLVL